MKFGKAYKKQMVPEWVDAYMDYNGLKRILRVAVRDQHSKQLSKPFVALQHKFSSCRFSRGLELQSRNQGDIKDQLVTVNTDLDDGFMHSFEIRSPNSIEGSEGCLRFFSKLDEELDKVNTFYGNKVKEAVNEAALLNKQMDALAALRIKVINPDLAHATTEGRDSTDPVTILPVQRTIPTGTRTPGTAQKFGVEIEEMADTKEVCVNLYEQGPLNILEHVKFNNSTACSTSTIKCIFKDPKEDELRKAEERLRHVFIEFYRELCLLRHYRLMNLSAFAKIMKKYEKSTSEEAAISCMKRVKSSLGSSDEVPSLLHAVEATFIKHFSSSNRREGMKSLRPKTKKEKQSVSFLSGLCFGCAAALLVAIVLTFSTERLIERKEGVSYMENIFPLYSVFAYMVLHMLVYAANIHFWRRYRINYPFIFGFKQGTELGYWEVFLLSNGLAILAMTSFLINLRLDMEDRFQNNKTLAEWIPLGLATVVLIIIVCPFDVIYRSSRVFFVRSIFRCICTPVYQVTFTDIFMADQLTSQVQAIRCLELYVCYYGLGELEKRQKRCHTLGVYNIFYFLVAAIPYWLRFLQELRRIKPVSKMTCHSVASWCHPRAPNLDILTCVKDSHIWAIEHPTYSALTRPLCELSSLVPPQILASTKKLRVYCMVAHPLQPHLVAAGTNIGVIISEFDPRSLPSVAPLPTPSGSREHSAVYVVGRELKLLNFQLSTAVNPSLGNNGSLSETAKLRGDSVEPLQIKQIKKHISTPVPHDSYSVLSASSSGKYLAIVWPDIPYFSVYKVSDWSIVDSGCARLLAWDTCRDRFAILESVLTPRMPIIPKGGSSRKAKEAAAAAAQAAAAAASAASSATVQVRILLEDGTSNILMRSIGGRSEPVIGLHGGALLGIAYRTSRRISPAAATAISTIQSMPLSGYGSSGLSSFNTFDDGFSSQKSPAEAAPQNFQLYSWETFQPVGGLLPQPEWTSWDQTVEYCAFAYQQYIVISSLRPQYRYLGDVAIPYAIGAVWHRRQLFVVTPTTIEVVFVDAGVAPIDIETRKMKEEMKLKEAQSTAVAEHGELALIAVDGPKSESQERITLRPPMLQVVRIASFQHAPSVPPFLSLPKQSKADGDNSAMPKEIEERKVNEVAVGGGGVSVAVTRFPSEQKRPVGPLVVVGVRDGVLWLIDRYMFAHALSLSHPGIRCKCLAAYGDAVSAVKWASRLGREHHDDLAQFMMGMGYANEALHLPGISKRLEFDLAMQSNDLKRALQCLLTMSNSRDIGQDALSLDLTDILNLTAKKEDLKEAVQGIVKFAKEFMDLIDAADATAQADIGREALKRLAAAGSVKGALQGHELRGLALRLANHGELTRLSALVSNLISVGQGREAAFAAALLGDNTLMEKAWQDTGMLAEAVLHAHAHGRPTMKSLVEAWNKMLQKEVEHGPSTKTDAAAAFLSSLEEPKLTSLSEAGKKPPIEILPPGMPSLSASILQKKPPPAAQNSQQQPEKPLLIEAASIATVAPVGAPAQSETSEPSSENKPSSADDKDEAAKGEDASTSASNAPTENNPPTASTSDSDPEKNSDNKVVEDNVVATPMDDKAQAEISSSLEDNPGISVPTSSSMVNPLG